MTLTAVLLIFCFQDFKSIYQAFPVSRLVALEETEASMIGGRYQVLMVEDGFWVADGSFLYSFDGDGRFMTRVASQGAGPGELQRPGRLHRIHDHQIAVSDWDRGNLVVFSSDGSYRFETVPGVFPEYAGMGLDDVVWPSPSKLFLFGRSHSSDGTWHALLRWRNAPPSAPAQEKIGFGERHFEGDLRYKLPVQAVQVGNEIWVGYSTATQVEVFDLEGRFLKVLPQPSGAYSMEAFHSELSQAADQNRWFEQHVSMGKYTVDIHDVGPVVVIYQNLMGGMLLYRPDGSLVSENRLKTLQGILDAKDGRVIMRFHNIPGEKKGLAGQLFGQEFGMWEALGLPDQYENPVLRIGEWKGDTGS